MLFTNKQIQSLLEIIDKNIFVFIGSNVGFDLLSDSDKELLLKSGINVNDIPQKNYIELSFKYGILSIALGDKRAKAMDFDTFKDFVASKNFIPLSPVEELALSFVKQRSYNDLKGLSNNIKRETYNKILNNEFQETIKLRKGVKELSSILRSQLKDFNRDFDRVSDFIMHEAYDFGRASFIQNNYGVDAKVYKSVYSGACEICQSLYLTNGLGSKPRIFKLSELISNGNNIGRTSKEYKAVIGATHPYCRCTIHDVPENYDWSNEKMQFVPVRNTYGVKRNSKAKIEIS